MKTIFTQQQRKLIEEINQIRELLGLSLENISKHKHKNKNKIQKLKIIREHYVRAGGDLVVFMD